MFSPQNVTPYAWAPLIVIWVVMAVVLIADIVQTSKSRVRALLWTLTVLLLPVVSGILYAIVSLTRSFLSSLADSRPQS